MLKIGAQRWDQTTHLVTVFVRLPIGDWSGVLNSFANEGVAELQALSQEKRAEVDTPLEASVQVMLESWYHVRGCGVDLHTS